MRTTLDALQPDAATALPPAVSFAQLQEIVGFPAYWERETRYKAAE
jgi:hypothetical protein